MRLVLVVLVCVLSTSCQIKSTKIDTKNGLEKKLLDTISSVSLEGLTSIDKKDYYRVTHLYDLDKNGYKIDSTHRIVLSKNDKTISNLQMPTSDNVKNFSISNILETPNGFAILTNWGGGNFFYNKEFYFVFKENQFYLDNIKTTNFVLDAQSETTSINEIEPRLLISKFDINHFIQNK